MKSEQEITSIVIIVTCFVLTLFFLCIGLLPNLKSLKELFNQISNVSYVILYTIGLILFFTFISKEIINNNAKYITPITIGLGLLAFYKSFQSDYITNFNSNYERIKIIILMFSLITCYVIYYNKDPGGYISHFFGYSFLLTILIAVFGFLYLITLFTLPELVSSNKINFFNKESSFTFYGSILFFIFLLVMTGLITTYPGGFLNDKISAPVSIILLLICIIWSVLLISSSFPDLTNKFADSNKINLFKQAMLVLFGIIVSGLLIFWIVYNIQKLSGQSSIISFSLNILLVLIVLAFIYKIMNVNFPTGNTKKNGFFNLLFSLVFYIPCIFSGIFDKIGGIFANELNSSNMGSIIMLLFAVLLVVIYFSTPVLFNKVSSQGGQQLVNKPVYTDSLYSLGTYEQLNGKNEFDYQYAISSWIYLDSAGPNTNASYKNYTSLLNFANKPNIMYNGSENTIMITMEQKNLEQNTENKLTDFDNNGNRIIYKNTNVPLQKWNHFIINYNGGIMDIFLNGELVKSIPGVIPYYTLDSLTIGEKNGIKGGICNVVYFRNVLTRNNIYYLYNTVKNKTPPVTMDKNTTIVENDISNVLSSN